MQMASSTSNSFWVAQGITMSVLISQGFFPGVGAREIGYLYGQYKRLLGKAESSALTGKGLTYGGSKVRLEAAGSGTVYFLARMLESKGDTLQGSVQSPKTLPRWCSPRDGTAGPLCRGRWRC